MNTITLHANDSINLSTGAVTRSVAPANATPLAQAVRRNDLAALHIAFILAPYDVVAANARDDAQWDI